MLWTDGDSEVIEDGFMADVHSERKYLPSQRPRLGRSLTIPYLTHSYIFVCKRPALRFISEVLISLCRLIMTTDPSGQLWTWDHVFPTNTMA